MLREVQLLLFGFLLTGQAPSSDKWEEKRLRNLTAHDVFGAVARGKVGVVLWWEEHGNATSPLTTRRQTIKMGKKKQEKPQKTPDPPPEEVPKEKEVAPGLLESDW